MQRFVHDVTQSMVGQAFDGNCEDSVTDRSENRETENWIWVGNLVFHSPIVKSPTHPASPDDVSDIVGL